MNNLGDNLQLLNLEPVKSVTANGDSAALDLQSIEGEVALLLDVSAPVAGTNPGLALKLTHSDTSGGSYTDVTGGGATAVAADASAQKISLKKEELKRWVKLNRVISGTDSPEYLLSAKIVGFNKYL